MLCFWTERAAALEKVLLIPYIFLSGLVAPLEVFPESIRSIVMLTPFPYFLSFPARILSGAELDYIHDFIVLGLWGLLFWILSSFGWKNGVKNYSAMGA